MATKKKTTEDENLPATTGDGALAAMPDFMSVEDSGGGMEGADKDSFATPFLRVLQKISPQCDEADSAYIDGAKGGMFLDSVSNALYDGKEGVIFLPCAFQRRYLRWAARGEDGGFKGEFLPEEVRKMQETGKVVELDGKLLVADDNGEVSEKKSDVMTDTRSHFGLLVTPSGVQQTLLTLTSTQIKKSKQLMSILSAVKVKDKDGSLVTPPSWMNRIRITTVPESNDHGSWHGVRFEADGFVGDKATYDAGKAFRELVLAGEAKANYAADAESTEAADDGERKF